MGDPTAPVTDSWDRLVRLGEQIGRDDWDRATPCPGVDVAGLVAHVAGMPPAPARRRGTPALLDGLRTARHTQLARTATWSALSANPETPDRAAADRLVGAWCSDLWVHGYDLSSALGEQTDLDDEAADLTTACGYLLRFVPHLFARRAGADDGDALRLAVRGPVDQDRVLTVREGRGAWSPDTRHVTHSVSATPGALVLLLSGRANPDQLRDLGALDWSGARGEAFVRRARLLTA